MSDIEPLLFVLLLGAMVILAVSALRSPERWSFLMTGRARRTYLVGVGVLAGAAIVLELTVGGATGNDLILIVLLGAALAVGAQWLGRRLGP